MSHIYGALEAGGTRMVLSILNETGEMSERVTIPTENPNRTIELVIDFFAKRQIEALGICSFGPLDLNPASDTYGYITSTPKLQWRDFPLLPVMSTALQVPVKLDTNCNGAALAEVKMGVARTGGSCLYVTVGTGIGGGIAMHGRPVHGMMHPEMGHQMVVPDPRDPTPVGFCPYHKGCLEGLASGTALRKRWGMPGEEIPQDHVAWDIEANYLAQMCYNAIMMMSPAKIVLGGGVMQQEFLFPMIRQKTLALLKGYINTPQLKDGLENYIVQPGLGMNSGVTGAWLLAKKALEEAQ